MYEELNFSTKMKCIFSESFNSIRNWIFSVWWHADFFNEKFTINGYFYAKFEYNFFDKSILQKLCSFRVIFSVFNTEDTLILIFPIYSMLFDVIKLG